VEEKEKRKRRKAEAGEETENEDDNDGRGWIRRGNGSNNSHADDYLTNGVKNNFSVNSAYADGTGNGGNNVDKQLK